MPGNDKIEHDRRSMLNSVNDGHNMFGDNDGGVTAERRPLLKGLAVSISSVLGLGGTVAADLGKEVEMKQRTKAAIADYETRGGVNEALDAHGSELMAKLTNSAFLTAGLSTTFQQDTVRVMEAPAEVDPEEGTYVTASEQQGEFTAHVSIVRKTPTHIVRLNVQPQIRRSFATVKTRDGELVAVVDPSVEDNQSLQATRSSDDDVSIQKSCDTDGYTCPPGSCCYNCGAVQVKHERICCVYADGSMSCYEEPINKCCDPLVCC